MDSNELAVRECKKIFEKHQRKLYLFHSGDFEDFKKQKPKQWRIMIACFLRGFEEGKKAGYDYAKNLKEFHCPVTKERERK